MSLNKTRPVAAYVRVKAIRHSDRLLDRQVDGILSTLSCDDFDIVGVYREDVTRGGSDQRTGLLSLLSDLSNGIIAVDAVAVTSRDRLSRHVNSSVFAQLAEFGVEVIETENVMTQAA